MSTSTGLSDNTVNCYEEADAVRKEILTRPLAFANAWVSQLQRVLQNTRAVEGVSELQTKVTETRGGLLSNDAIAKANSLLKILNGK